MAGKDGVSIKRKTLLYTRPWQKRATLSEQAISNEPITDSHQLSHHEDMVALLVVSEAPEGAQKRVGRVERRRRERRVAEGGEGGGVWGGEFPLPTHRTFLNLCLSKWHVLIDFMKYEQFSAVNRNASIKTRIQATKPDGPDYECPVLTVPVGLYPILSGHRRSQCISQLGYFFTNNLYNLLVFEGSRGSCPLGSSRRP